MHVSAHVSVQYSHVVPYVPVPDTARQSGQVSGQIAPLQQSYSYQVAELTESDAPPAAQNLSNSNDLASVLSLLDFWVSCRNSSDTKTCLMCDPYLCNTIAALFCNNMVTTRAI